MSDIWPADDYGDHGVPADLVELYEVLEWENAVAHGEGRDLPHPAIGVPPGTDPGVANSTPLVSRSGWGAREPLYITPRDLTENTGHYGGPSPWGSAVDRSSAERFAAACDHNRCATIVRAYQAFHMDQRGWADIAYSSLACPHGTRYEGRGHDVRTAAQGTTIGNDTSHATCYIAGAGDPLTTVAMLAFLDEHVRLGPLDKGHRDWKSTACPGDPLHLWIHAGRPIPPFPPEEDDMTPEQLVAELFSFLVPKRIAADDWRSGDPIYLGDDLTWKVQVPHGGALDLHIRSVYQFFGKDWNARRRPQALIDSWLDLGDDGSVVIDPTAVAALTEVLHDAVAAAVGTSVKEGTLAALREGTG